LTIKNKLTVIIPTLAVPDVEITNYTLFELKKSEAVKQVFIIDNTADGHFKKKYTATMGCKVITDQPNLYVNPAWNHGVSLTDTPYYLLLNDDVMLRHEVLDLLVDLLEKNNNINITSVKTYNFNRQRHVGGEGSKGTYNIDDVIHGVKCLEYIIPAIDKSCPPIGSELEYEFRAPPYRQGWFMVGRTESWVPLHIPECGNVMAGDDWIYDHNVKQGYEGACVVSNCRIYHAESQTVHSKTNLYGKTLPYEEKD